MKSQQIQVGEVYQSNNRSYLILQSLGFGSYGQVYKGQDTKTGELVAIKQQSRLNNKEKELLNILINAKLQNNVGILGFEDKGTHYNVIQEYCGQNLYDRICLQSTFTENEFRYVMMQIANGIRELHELNFVHRDIKPENILIYEVHDKATNQIQITYKICDYGLVSRYDLINTINVGTPLYQAPEQIQTSKYGKPVDIWALGAVMFELITGISLFSAKSLQEIKDKVLTLDINQKIDKMEKKIDQKYKDLLKEMLNRVPNKRPTIEEVITKLKIKINIPKRAGSPSFQPQNNSTTIVQSNQPNLQNNNNQTKIQNPQITNPVSKPLFQNQQVIHGNLIQQNLPNQVNQGYIYHSQDLQKPDNIINQGQQDQLKPVNIINQGQNNLIQDQKKPDNIINQGQILHSQNFKKPDNMINQGQIYHSQYQKQPDNIINQGQQDQKKPVNIIHQGQNNLIQDQKKPDNIINQGQIYHSQECFKPAINIKQPDQEQNNLDIKITQGNDIERQKYPNSDCQIKQQQILKIVPKLVPKSDIIPNSGQNNSAIGVPLKIPQQIPLQQNLQDKQEINIQNNNQNQHNKTNSQNIKSDIQLQITNPQSMIEKSQ